MCVPKILQVGGIKMLAGAPHHKWFHVQFREAIIKLGRGRADVAGEKRYVDDFFRFHVLRFQEGIEAAGPFSEALISARRDSSIIQDDHVCPAGFRTSRTDQTSRLKAVQKLPRKLFFHALSQVNKYFRSILLVLVVLVLAVPQTAKGQKRGTRASNRRRRRPKRLLDAICRLLVAAAGRSTAVQLPPLRSRYVHRFRPLHRSSDVQQRCHPSLHWSAAILSKNSRLFIVPHRAAILPSPTRAGS